MYLSKYNAHLISSKSNKKQTSHLDFNYAGSFSRNMRHEAKYMTAILVTKTKLPKDAQLLYFIM